MKENLTIAIDCDEVLRDTLNSMISLYNREFNQQLTRDDIKDFDVAVSFPEIMKQTGKSATAWFFDDHSLELFVGSKAKPCVDWCIETLKGYGDVTILSYQKSYFNKKDTLEFLNINNLNTTNVCFMKDKSRLDCDIIIDDNPKYFENCKAKVCVLITAPYNKDVDLNLIANSCNCQKVLRFDSLLSFTKYFKQINGNLI